VNVAELQDFLRHLGALLEASKGSSAKLGADFQALCDGLDPFKDQTVVAFAQFLRKAEEYHRTGLIPESGKKPATRKPAAKTTKPVLKKKDDVPAVEAAAASLQRLYERTSDLALTHEEIEKEVDRIDAEFDGDGLKAVAKKFGITSGIRSKKDARDRILKRIADRKGQTERGEVIAQQAVPPRVVPLPIPTSAEEPDVVVEESPSTSE
jgi:hypothetical protein